MSAEDSNKFASALLDHYEPNLKKIQTQLGELTSKQAVIIKGLEVENQKFSDLPQDELNKMMTALSDYHVRLRNLKKTMIILSDTALRIKERALRLLERKQQEALQSAHQVEDRTRREQSLIQPSTSHS